MSWQGFITADGIQLINNWASGIALNITSVKGYANNVLKFSGSVYEKKINNNSLSLRVAFPAAPSAYTLDKIEICGKLGSSGNVVVIAIYEGSQDIPANNQQPDFLFTLWCNMAITPPEEGEIVVDIQSNIYAPLENAGLLGLPTAPTANPGTSTEQIATTRFVTEATSGVITYINQNVIHSPEFTGTPLVPNITSSNPPESQITNVKFVQEYANYAVRNNSSCLYVNKSDYTSRSNNYDVVIPFLQTNTDKKNIFLYDKVARTATVIGKNKFNKNDPTIINGKFLYKTGYYTTDASWQISPFIAIEPNTQYAISFTTGTIPSGVSAYICFYALADEQAVISQSLSVVFDSNPKIITTPGGSTVKFMRVSYPASARQTLQIEKNSQPTPYEAYSETTKTLYDTYYWPCIEINDKEDEGKYELYFSKTYGNVVDSYKWTIYQYNYMGSLSHSVVDYDIYKKKVKSFTANPIVFDQWNCEYIWTLGSSAISSVLSVTLPSTITPSDVLGDCSFSAQFTSSGSISVIVGNDFDLVWEDSNINYEEGYVYKFNFSFLRNYTANGKAVIGCSWTRYQLPTE